MIFFEGKITLKIISGWIYKVFLNLRAFWNRGVTLGFEPRQGLAPVVATSLTQIYIWYEQLFVCLNWAGVSLLYFIDKTWQYIYVHWSNQATQRNQVMRVIGEGILMHFCNLVMLNLCTHAAGRLLDFLPCSWPYFGSMTCSTVVCSLLSCTCMLKKN